MYDYVRRLYRAGRLTPEGLQGAVDKGWITEEQRDEILAGG